ncbi:MULTISPECIES: hypothetical protein [unclassified Mesorhizobium]
MLEVPRDEEAFAISIVSTKQRSPPPTPEVNPRRAAEQAGK